MSFAPNSGSEEQGNRHRITYKSRKSRPSRARGLRTSTGCLTCRRRRVKCDETRPRCKNCGKSDRLCEYTYLATLPPSPGLDSREEASSLTHGEEAAPQVLYGSNLAPENAVSMQTLHSLTNEPSGQAHEVIHGGSSSIWPRASLATPRQRNAYEQLNDSPGTVRSSLFDYDLTAFDNLEPFCTAPFDWYDLLAADAIKNLQSRRNVNEDFLPDFDATSLSRRHSPAPGDRTVGQTDSGTGFYSPKDEGTRIPLLEPWNSPSRIVLDAEQLGYFQHYVDAIAPILDLFDPDKHFTVVVPHLALRNEGLLKSLLAVAARHMALLTTNRGRNHEPSAPSSVSSLSCDPTEVATRFYYETLGYLSQTLLYPSYTHSLEILATAIMISTYEMFDAYVSSNNNNWERHLQGAFWIQRSQDNNGESADGLRRAVWWAWLRQDIWAAFRAGRPAMTIWQPKKALRQLDSNELANFIIFIAAKCVQFAASNKTEDLVGHIERGKGLLKYLDDWKKMLPPSFEPIRSDKEFMSDRHLVSDGKGVFAPIWIHPPQHAAAIQMYHFARLVVLLHQTSTGGPAAYRQKEKQLTESVDTICGIAAAESSRNPSNMLVSLQAIFVAGLCSSTAEREHALLALLTETLDISPFAPPTLANEWQAAWSSGL